MTNELCPLKTSDILQTMQELNTLAEYGYIKSGQDIEDDVLETLINSDNN